MRRVTVNIKQPVDFTQSVILSAFDFSVAQEEAAGSIVQWLRPSHHHLRQPEEGL